jgi:cytochrome c oxidase subunit 2
MRAALWLFAISACSTASGGPTTLAPAGAEEEVVAISARQFTYSPSVIHAKLGQPIVLELRSLDRAHGFNLPDFGVRTDVGPGEAKRVRIVPDRRGTFPFHCDVFCGEGHESMSGEFVVE